MPNCNSLLIRILSNNIIIILNKVIKDNFNDLAYLPFLNIENKSLNLTLSLLIALSIVYIVTAIICYPINIIYTNLIIIASINLNNYITLCKYFTILFITFIFNSIPIFNLIIYEY